MGQDALPVYRDAVNIGVIQATGNAKLSRLTAVASICAEEAGIGDDGKSITATGKPVMGGMCLLRTLRAPDHVIEHAQSTRAIDGLQTAEWDGISAKWSYHPDTGLNVPVVDTLRG